jgi:hypothetical protein
MWRIRSSSGREIPVEEGRDGTAGMWRSCLCLVLWGFLKYTHSVKVLVRALKKIVVFHINAAEPRHLFSSLPIVINPS